MKLRSWELLVGWLNPWVGERIEDAVAKRNLLFLAFCQGIVTPDAGLLDLPMQMLTVLDEYLSIESRHAPISNDTEGQGAGMTKFELF